MCVGTPDGISAMVELGVPGMVIEWTPPTCSDVSDTATIVSSSHNPGSFFQADTTTQVTYICQDISGNSEMCVFPVVVLTGKCVIRKVLGSYDQFH